MTSAVSIPEVAAFIKVCSLWAIYSYSSSTFTEHNYPHEVLISFIIRQNKTVKL